MDYRVTWSPEALDDIESISEFISRDSEFYAKTVVNKIVGLSRKLNTSPKRGRIVPELDDEEIRELFVYSYRLIYRIYENTILIVAVVHGKRLLEPLSDNINKI